MNCPPEIWARIFTFTKESKIKCRTWRLLSRVWEMAWQMWIGGEEECTSLLAARLLIHWRCKPVLIDDSTFREFPGKVRLENGSRLRFPKCAEGEVIGRNEYYLKEGDNGYTIDSSFGYLKLSILHLRDDNTYYNRKPERQILWRNCVGPTIKSAGSLSIEGCDKIVIDMATEVEVRNSYVTLGAVQEVRAWNSTLIFSWGSADLTLLRAINCEIFGLRYIARAKQELVKCEKSPFPPEEEKASKISDESVTTSDEEIFDTFQEEKEIME